MGLGKLRRMVRAAGSVAGCRRAATAIEYGLIIALVVLAIIVALRGLAAATIDKWNTVGSNVAAVSPA